MTTASRPDPAILVIFGAGGDLTWRKLVPALFNLFLDKWLPDRFAVIGVEKRAMTDEEFRGRLRDGVERFSRRKPADEAAWAVLSPILEVWDAVPPGDFPNYAAGTWGPEAAEVLIARDGRSWVLPALPEDGTED